MVTVIEVFENLENPDPNYAQMYQRFGYPDKVEPWETLAAKSPQPCRLLDLGCGTGYISIPLVRLGYQVVGVDADPQMLKIAKEVCPNFETVNCQIKDLNLKEKFDGVLISSPLLNICSENDRNKILEKAAAHLKPGGWLGMELFNPAWLKKGESFHSSIQKISCHLVDTDNLIWYGEIRYCFKDVHYLQRLTIRGFEEKWLKDYLKQWNLHLSEKFPINRLQNVYVSILS